jgi:hypothetical protein
MLFFLISPLLSAGGEWQKPKGTFILKLGILGGGKAECDEWQNDSRKKAGVSGGFALVFPIYRKLYIGPSGDIYQIKSDDIDDKECAIDPAYNFKLRIPYERRKMSFWPTIAIGYAFPKNTAEYPNIYCTSGKIFCDAVWHFSQKTGLLAEAGFGFSNWVHYEDKDVTIPPMLALRGGLLF